MLKKIKKKERLKQNLLKLGEIAQELGVLPSTINYYVDVGLLQVRAYTPGRYRLFRRDETILRFQQIKSLKRHGISISEIKKIICGK
jgi:DNA-binding transcriptional MerR regulator